MTDFDDRLRTELDRRSDWVQLPREWARHDLLPAVMSGIETRPQKVATSRAPAFAGLVAAVGILAVLVLALPRALPSAAATPPPSPQPVTSSASQETSEGTFTLTIVAGSDWYGVNEPMDVHGEVLYEGPAESAVVTGNGHLVAGFGVEQVDGPYSVGPSWGQPCVSDLLVRDEPRIGEFKKSGAWYDGDPNAGFTQQYLADPLLRLPAGTWRVTAYTEFWAGECGQGDYVELEASVEIVVSNAPPTQSPVVPSSPSTPLTNAISCNGHPAVTLTDSTGLVRGCSPWEWDHTDENSPPYGASNPDGDTSRLLVTWEPYSGCINRAAVDFSSAGDRYVVRLVQGPNDQPCLGPAWVAGFYIDLTSPIDASQIRFEEDLEPDTWSHASPTPEVAGPTPNSSPSAMPSLTPPTSLVTVRCDSGLTVVDESGALERCEYSNGPSAQTLPTTITNIAGNANAVEIAWADVCRRLEDFHVRRTESGFQLTAFNPLPRNVVCDGAPRRHEVRLYFSEPTPASSVELVETRSDEGILPPRFAETDCAELVPAPRWPIHVSAYDATGLVQSCTTVEPARAALVYAEPVVDIPDTNANAFRLSWLGGACDSDMRLMFDQTETGYRVAFLHEAADSEGQECIAVGVGRAIEFVLEESVPIDKISIGCLQISKDGIDTTPC